MLTMIRSVGKIGVPRAGKQDLGYCIIIEMYGESRGYLMTLVPTPTPHHKDTTVPDAWTTEVERTLLRATCTYFGIYVHNYTYI